MDVVPDLNLPGLVVHADNQVAQTFWAALALAVHGNTARQDEAKKTVMGEVVDNPQIYQHLIVGAQDEDEVVLAARRKVRQGIIDDLVFQAAANVFSLDLDAMLIKDGSAHMEKYQACKSGALMPICLAKHGQDSWYYMIPTSSEGAEQRPNDTEPAGDQDEAAAEEDLGPPATQMKPWVMDDLENALISLHNNTVTKPFKELLNIPLKTIDMSVRKQNSHITSGPWQHNKTHVMSGICAVNARQQGPQRPTVVIQKDVVTNVRETCNKMVEVVKNDPMNITTMYVSGGRGLCKLLQDESNLYRFKRGLLVPVMPGHTAALEGLNNAIAAHNLCGINLLMDEADALVRSFVDFQTVQHEEQLQAVKITKFEEQLYKLLGMPQRDANGQLSGFALGLNSRVRCMFWVSATHLPTMFAHAMWGMPVKYLSMSEQLLAERQYSSYQHLTPLKDEQGRSMFVQEEECRDVARLQGPKAKRMFMVFREDVTKQGLQGYRGDRCMLQVSVTRAVNAGDNSSVKVMHKCLKLYHECGQEVTSEDVNAPEPILLGVFGAGCVLVPSELTPVVPEFINGDVVQRHKISSGTLGRHASQRYAPLATPAGTSAAAGHDVVDSSSTPPGSSSKRRRNYRPPKMKAHEVLDMIEKNPLYEGRPIIVVGLTCVGRSVSLRGTVHVITHVIAAPGVRIPSADLSQLLMRCGGDTLRVREQINKYMGGVKLLVQQQDYKMLQELYPFTQELGRRLAGLEHTPSLDVLAEQIREIYMDPVLADKYKTVRTSVRPHVTRRLDPNGILDKAFDAAWEEDSDEESDEEISDEEEDEEEIQEGSLQARRRLDMAAVATPHATASRPRSQAGPSNAAGPSTQQQQQGQHGTPHKGVNIADEELLNNRGALARQMLERERAMASAQGR